MKDKINLQKLEKSSASRIYQTGLVDIGIGMIFIVSSLTMLFDDIRYYLDILFIVPVIFLIFSKKYIAAPRMGVVELAAPSKRRNKYFIGSITLFLLIMVTLTIFADGDYVIELINPRWLITAIIFLICLSIAYFLRFDRMYIYAFLLSAVFNWSEHIRETPGLISNGGFAYLTVSILLIIIGMIYLYKFLKSHPLPDQHAIL